MKNELKNELIDEIVDVLGDLQMYPALMMHNGVLPDSKQCEEDFYNVERLLEVLILEDIK